MRQRHAKLLTYRNIVGKNKNGEIIFVVSNFGGVVTIEDVINEGVKQGMVEGILFDGGSSVEHVFNDGKYSTSFIALSDGGKKLSVATEPYSFFIIPFNLCKSDCLIETALSCAGCSGFETAVCTDTSLPVSGFLTFLSLTKLFKDFFILGLFKA